ncbi:MAG: ATP-binding cassette domain-containing protein, partial [Chloroflexi bacterium]|nr:ATP-binding cassette domain-containing protein [Chloroflexota bacterium]
LCVGLGVVFGFLGPNGAGKTTGINVLLGFVNATRGAVCFGLAAYLEPREQERAGSRAQSGNVLEILLSYAQIVAHLADLEEREGHLAQCIYYLERLQKVSPTPEIIQSQRWLIDVVDGGYSNRTFFQGLPERTDVVARVRKDAKFRAVLPPEQRRGARK